MGRPPTYLLALALGLAAIALSACGEEDAQLLPGSTASEITANLETVKKLSDEGDCVGAEEAAREVSEQIEAIQGVDPKLKRALANGADKLNEVISECEEATTEPTAPAEVPSQAEEGREKPQKPEKEKQPKPEKEKPKEEEQEVPEPGAPGPPEEAPPAVPPGQEEPPSGGVGPGSPVEEEG